MLILCISLQRGVTFESYGPKGVVDCTLSKTEGRIPLKTDKTTISQSPKINLLELILARVSRCRLQVVSCWKSAKDVVLHSTEIDMKK